MCHLMTLAGITEASHPDAARALVVATGLGLLSVFCVMALGTFWGDISGYARCVWRDLMRMCGRSRSSARSASVHARRLDTSSCLDTARGGAQHR